MVFPYHHEKVECFSVDLVSLAFAWNGTSKNDTRNDDKSEIKIKFSFNHSGKRFLAHLEISPCSLQNIMRHSELFENSVLDAFLHAIGRLQTTDRAL